MRPRLTIPLAVLTAGGLLAAAAAGWLALSSQPGPAVVERTGVLFVTNRRHVENAAPAERFDGRRGQLRHGRCTVRYRPLPLSEDLAETVDFHVPTRIREVESVERLDHAAFEQALEAQGQRPIVLFVHGYAYGFARTCRMGAGLQRMLGDNATVVMFSWPSDANPTEYVADQADIEWSVPELAALIERMRARFSAGRLYLLAHSLGTRGVLQALDDPALARHPDPLAAHLVLLAPDYDAAVFRDKFPHIREHFSRMTLYASDNDTPLRLSRTLHGHPRLGEAGPDLTVLEGLETIDVSPLGRYHPTGHEYFFYHPVAGDDLVELITRRAPPAQRTHPQPQSRHGLRYWTLDR